MKVMQIYLYYMGEAIRKIDKIYGFLMQSVNESFTLEQSVKLLMEAVSDDKQQA